MTFSWVATAGSVVLLAGLAITTPASAQSAASPGMTTVSLTDLSAFRTPPANWRIAGDATASLAQANVLTTKAGAGVLVNLPAAPNQYGPQYDLLTTLEHGDADLELDFMMAKGSNSGVYLQGRYEVQLFDSWGTKSPKAGDNGSIYERWDDTKPDGSKGYDGHPARQNASRAPGLWQHLRISFQAPRFDASGQKTENARMLRVELNGVTIHENVELSGPTRGSRFADEKATGPLLFQGDHGAVAIRNLQYVSFDKARPALTNLKYAVYKGNFQEVPNFTTLTPESSGTLPALSAAVTTMTNNFVVRYTGTLRVSEPGEYNFIAGLPGGGGILKINDQVVIKPTEWNGTGKATLPAGDLPFELLYSKQFDWAKPGLGLSVSGPGVREFSMTDASVSAEEIADPILVEAGTNTVLRSFMDLPGLPGVAIDGEPVFGNGKSYRVTHGVSVGSPEQLHYTYDLDKGAVVQVWRGQFLDATPMWNDRGDGSSRPLGAVQRMGLPALLLANLVTPQSPWPTDTTGSGFRPKGYALDDSDRPTFRYVLNGATISDELRLLDGGQGFRRELTVTNPTPNLHARLAEASTIEPLENGLYLIDGKAYYIRTEPTATPNIRSQNGRQELIVPVKSGKLTYSILF
jgi:hypothetical protein